MTSRSRVPTSVLYKEGPFETGCFTSAGNELALWVDNNRDLHDRKIGAFRKARKNIKATDGAPLLPQGPPPAGRVWDITRNCGIFVPTLVHNYCVDAFRSLYRAAVGKYNHELEEPLQTEGDTYDDFVLWMIRGLERWLNEEA